MTQPQIMGGGGSCSEIGQTHVDGLAHIHEGAKAFQLHQTSNKKSSKFNSKRLQQALNVSLALILIFALLPIINPSMFQQQNKQQAEADGAPTFGEVSFRQGSRIVMNDGKKSATFLKDKQQGGKLTDTWFLSDQVNSNVTIHNYGSDKIIKDFKNECSPDAAADAIKDDADGSFLTKLRVADLKEYSHLLPKTTDSFWLRNWGQDFMHKELQYAFYANADNTLPNNVLKVSGRIGDWTYDNTQIAKGPYAWRSDVETVTDIIGAVPTTTIRKAGIWNLNGTNELTFPLYSLSKYPTDFIYGVYNNPWCITIGANMRGDKGAVLIFAPVNKDTWRSAKIAGCVGVDDGVVYQVRRGDIIKKGTTLLVAFTPTKELQDYKDYYDHALKSTYGRYYGFCQAREDFEINTSPLVFTKTFTIRGFDSVYDMPTLVKGESIVAQKKHWRPGFRIDPSKIAFFRKADNSDVRISNQLSPNNMPTSVADSNNSYKLVLKDESMGLSQSLVSFATDKGEAKIESGTVHVPYGAKTLTIKNLKKRNATHVSALSDKDGTKKYSILGSGSDVTIDLKSIINTQIVQDSATVSLFAEQLNGAGTSDKISSEPFSFKIQVTGSPYTLTYDADGGSGVSLPKPATVNSGDSVTLANGSGLTKDGNPFSKWLVTYKLTDKSPETLRLMNSGEMLTMPAADVKVKALYSSIALDKNSDTGVKVNNDFWLAPAGSASPEAETTKRAYEILQDVEQIKKGDPTKIAEYTNIMNEDKIHFYTYLDNKKTMNSYLEMRIIHVGDHDGDGSGITLQAVHALAARYKWDTKWQKSDIAPTWANCSLRSTMNGSIFNSLPQGLQSAILPVSKKYNLTAGLKPNGGSSSTVIDKLWLISITEFVTNLAGKIPDNWSDNSHQGSTYAFWSSKNLEFGMNKSEQQRLLYTMNCNRAGTLLTEPGVWRGCAWVRSLSPLYSACVMQFEAEGYFSYGVAPNFGQCISPCFAL